MPHAIDFEYLEAGSQRRPLRINHVVWNLLTDEITWAFATALNVFHTSIARTRKMSHATHQTAPMLGAIVLIAITTSAAAQTPAPATNPPSQRPAAT
ncbi:MAG TPA: hypothetical protein VJX31_07900, partial [Casimicrobiaceae bacterium]|nr:hypothetical protein [Casimicrobiaceae bacterium]